MAFVCLFDSFLPFIFLSVPSDCSAPTGDPGDENFFRSTSTKSVALLLRSRKGGKHLTESSCRAVFSTSFIPLCLYKREKLKIGQECNTTDSLPRKHGRVCSNPFNHSTSLSFFSTQMLLSKGRKPRPTRCCWGGPCWHLWLCWLPPHQPTASEIFITLGHFCCLWVRFALELIKEPFKQLF